MRTAWSVLLALVVVLVLSSAARAEDKQITLKGEILCAKCALNETKKCTTAIVVKEEGKNVVYYFNDKGNKEDYHEEVCGGARKQGTVTGLVVVKEGKKWITPKKVEFAK